MKSRFVSIIMDIIIILIIVITILFGIEIYKELQENFADVTAEETTSKIETFKPDYGQISEKEEKNIEAPKIKTELNSLSQIESSNKSNTTSTQNNNYDGVSVNKWFYNQLDSNSQTVYKAFEANKENMKSGIYKIDFGSTFSELLSKQNGQEQLQNAYQSAIEAFLYDNPDVFYLSPKKMYLNIETIKKGNNTTYNVYLNSGEAGSYLTPEFNSKQKVEQAISKLEQVKNNLLAKKTGNTYNDVKMVHDYLVKNIQYDSSTSKENIYNIYGALINHECVCEGYAKSFKYILDSFGIESTLVIGEAYDTNGDSENHAWNYVKIDGAWYAVDVTWDDPIIIGGGTLSSSNRYKYFLKGLSTIGRDHFPSGQFTQNGKVFKYPNLNSADY